MKLKATGYLHEKHKNRETKLNKTQTNKIKDAIIQQWEIKHKGDFIAWKSKKW